MMFYNLELHWNFITVMDGNKEYIWTPQPSISAVCWVWWTRIASSQGHEPMPHTSSYSRLRSTLTCNGDETDVHIETQPLYQTLEFALHRSNIVMAPISSLIVLLCCLQLSLQKYCSFAWLPIHVPPSPLSQMLVLLWVYEELRNIPDELPQSMIHKSD